MSHHSPAENALPLGGNHSSQLCPCRLGSFYLSNLFPRTLPYMLSNFDSFLPQGLCTYHAWNALSLVPAHPSDLNLQAPSSENSSSQSILYTVGPHYTLPSPSVIVPHLFPSRHMKSLTVSFFIYARL